MDDAEASEKPDSDEETTEFLNGYDIKTYPNLLHYMLKYPKDKIKVA